MLLQHATRCSTSCMQSPDDVVMVVEVLQEHDLAEGALQQTGHT